MKRLLSTLILSALAATAFAAAQSPVRGKVTDDGGTPVEFANVIFMRDSVEVRGVATDSDGRFRTEIPDGDYTVRVQFLGYQTAERTVAVSRATDCGVFVLAQKAEEMEAVVVTSPIVRREADRFVVDVANAVSALGRDGVELLTQAPGVWVTDDRIEINGKSGSKVYVNGRELRMETQQMLTYLRSLRAEDIQKIEVVPQTGADFDADSSGGVIMITLRRQREDGVMGTVSFGTRHGHYNSDYSPNASIDYHHRRLDLYASAWGWFSDDKMRTVERTQYAAAADNSMEASSKMETSSRNGGGKIGAVYEISPRHSIGGEFQYFHDSEPSHSISQSTLASGGAVTSTDSRYDNRQARNQYQANLNYIWKIDSMGSTLKVLADYIHRTEDNGNDMRTLTATPADMRDSLYRDRTGNRYDIATLTVALEKNFTPKWQLKAGAKYTRNDMYNDARYEYAKDGAWIPNSEQSFTLDYSENIAALYGVASARLGRVSLVAGLRGEFTATRGKGDGVKQDYFSLFPNANISYMLTADGSHMLIAQYSRSIQRPSFWTLSPNRTQISDYIYKTGNPDIEPSYTDEISATYILKQKYSFSAGMTLSRDGIQQIVRQSTDNPDMLILTFENYGKVNNFYFSANLPFQLAKWWTLNANTTYMYYGMSIPPSTEAEYHHMFQFRASTSFILPCKFAIDVDYMTWTRAYLGNTTIAPMHKLSATVKKRLFDDRLTLSASVYNIIPQTQSVRVTSDGFTRDMRIYQAWNKPMFGIRAAYNFKAGKAFDKRAVESGSGEESGRL